MNDDGRWNWPGNAEVAVSLTIDADGETVWLADPQYERRHSRLSERRYGINRGVPRILDLFARYDVTGTFFVPGNTARLHPDLVPTILSGGHEIGHHGHMHVHPSGASTDTQRAEIERGLAALEACGVAAPVGYRSPAWELSATTLALLVEYGFVYDSSCMADDRPYFEETARGAILELPVHWCLEDYPRFGFTVDRGGNVGSEEEMLTSWIGEYRSAREEGRHVTFTMHPDIMGRAYRLTFVERFIETLRADGGVWIAPLNEVAEHVRPVLETSAA